MVFSSRKCLNVSSQIAVKVTLRKIAGKRKKTDNTQKSKNVGPKIVFNYPAHWFVYILMPGKKEWVLLQLGSQHILRIFCPFFSVSRRWNINLFSHLTLHNCRTMPYLLDSIKYTATSQVTYGIIRYVVSALISSQRFLRFVIQYDRKKQHFFHICYLSYRKSSGEIVPSCPQPKAWHPKA